MLKAVKNRPFLFFVLSFFVGMIIPPLLNIAVRAVFVSALLLFILSVALRRRPLVGRIRKAAMTLPLAIGIILGSCYHYFAIERTEKEMSYLDGSQKEITAVVEEITSRAEYFVSYTVRVVSINGEKESFPCALAIPYDIDADENDVIRLNVIFSRPEKDSYGFKLREYYASRGIYVTAEAIDENAVIIGIDRSIPSFFRRISNDISVKLKTALGREEGGFVSGLLIGRRSDVPESLTAAYGYLGISHILSVSGLHLTILTGAFALILRGLTLRRSIRYVLKIGFIIFFILLVGATPSVIRSGIMLILLMTASLIGRNYDPITSLSLAAFAIILFSPSAIYDARFILSVNATAGIILIAAPTTKWLYHTTSGKGAFLRAFAHFLTLITVTASATVFTIPTVWYYFGQISAVSLITNLLFIPLNTALMCLALIFLLLSKTPISSSLAGMTSSLARLIMELSGYLTKVLPPPIDLTYPFTVIAVTVSVTALIVFMIKKRRALALVLSMALFASTYYACLYRYSVIHKGEENVIIATISDNDYVLVNSGGNTLLCDFSDGGYSSASKAFDLVQPQLHDSSVDTVLLTHLHRKHIEMISRISDSERIRQVFIPMPQTDDERIFAEAISEVSRKRGITVTVYNSDRDVTFDFNGIKITLYQKAYIKRSVQPITLMLIDGKRDFIYAGSAVFESDLSDKTLDLLKTADVLLLGSHGPLIKEPLPALDFDGEIIVSNAKTNEAYQSSYNTVGFYKKYITG